MFFHWHSSPKSRYGAILISKMILRVVNDKLVSNATRRDTSCDFIHSGYNGLESYQVLVVSLICHNIQLVSLVLEFVLVFWHQKNYKNARQSDSM